MHKKCQLMRVGFLFSSLINGSWYIMAILCSMKNYFIYFILYFIFLVTQGQLRVPVAGSLHKVWILRDLVY